MKIILILLFTTAIFINAQSISVTPSSVIQGGVFTASWSGFSGAINLAVYKGGNFWVYANTNGGTSGSQQLNTAGWEIRNDYRVRAELKTNTSIYRESQVLSVTGQLPDLTVSSVSGPSTGNFTQGGVNITTTVSRTGGNLATPSYVEVRIYLSTNQTITTSDILVGTSNSSQFQSSTLNSTGSATGTISCDFNNLTPQNYYIGAIADAVNYHPESNENNNSRAGNSIQIGKITVNQPNGGETLIAGQQYSITWSSTNAGSTFTLDIYRGSSTVSDLRISSNATSPYLWTVPSSLQAGNNLKLWVGGLSGNCWDASDNNFTIQAPLPDLTVSSVSGPTTGNFTQGGVNITTTVSRTGGNLTIANYVQVQIYLSTDQAITTSDILVGTSTASQFLNSTLNANGTATHPISCNFSNLTPQNYYIGAIVDAINFHPESNENNNSKVGNSIQIGKITVLSPNGGETLTIGQSYSISWSSTNTGSSFSIDLYRGSSTQSERRINSSTTSPYLWIVPNDITPGTNLKIGISDNTQNRWDFSDNYFTIVQAPQLPDLTVSSVSGPTTGNFTQEGVNITTTVSRTGGNLTIADYVQVQIYLSTDQTITTSDILIGTSTASQFLNSTLNANGTATHPIICNFSNLAPQNYYIGAIVDAINFHPESNENNNSKVGNSIGIGKITVLSPNGGETLTIGQTYSISWSSTNTGSTFSIDLYRGTSTVSERRIISSTTNPYSWTVPSDITPGTNLKVGISDNTQNRWDFSDNFFTIVQAPELPDLMVSSVSGPATGNSTQDGLNIITTVSRTGGLLTNPFYVEVKVYLSVDQTIASSDILIGTSNSNQFLNSTLNSNGTATETILCNLNSITPQDYFIGAIVDEVNHHPEMNENNNTNVGNIIQIGKITVLYPNGGETLIIGQTYSIDWISTNAGNSFAIDLYRSSSTFSERRIVSSTSSPYSWTVPSDVTPGNDMTIGISGLDGKSWDFSDNFFSIEQSQTPSISLRFPLLNSSPNTRVITSLLDHNLERPYRKELNRKLINFLGKETPGNKKYYFFSGSSSYLVYGHSNSISNFAPGYNLKTPNEFWYMGHPAYDYRAAMNTDIYATAPGLLSYPSNAGYTIHSRFNWRHFGTIQIDHRQMPGQGEGYISLFLHCNTHPDYNILGTLPPIVNEGTYITQEQVNNGFVIGKTGKTSEGGTNGQPHLHYELHYVNANGKHIIVDPYGWYPDAQEGDPLMTGNFNVSNGGDNRPLSDKGKWLWKDTRPTEMLSLAMYSDQGDSSSNLLKNNSGDSWVIKNSQTLENLHTGKFLNDQIGFVLGDNGVILKTTDGGETWNHFLGIPVKQYLSIDFTNNLIGIIGGKNILLKTTNAGSSWSPVALPDIYNVIDTNSNFINFQKVQFASENIVYAAGAFTDAQAIRPMMFKSTNAGQSWSSIANFLATGEYHNKYVTDFYFENELVGFMTTYSELYQVNNVNLPKTEKTVVYKTQDGGNSWSESSDTEVLGLTHQIQKANNQIGYILSSDGIYKSVNLNNQNPNWSLLNSSPKSLMSMTLFGEKIYLGGNSGLIYSSINGTEWIPEPTPTESNIYSLDYRFSKILAVGSGGLIMIKNLPIPVELVEFSAQKTRHNNISLHWRTASETNNSGFEIERSPSSMANGGTFAKIGFVEGHGSTTTDSRYNFEDNLDSRFYLKEISYRLKQIDFDGSFSYSDTVKIFYDAVPEVFNLSQNYPNPFNPNTSVTFQLPQTANVKLELYDILGQHLLTVLNSEVEQGFHTRQITGDLLESGTYFLRMTVNEKQVKVIKLTLTK